MVENEIENLEEELRELDDVLDHSYFNEEEEELADIEDVFVFIGEESADFRSLDEL